MIGSAADVPAHGAKTFDVEGKSIVVARVGSGYCAVINKCPHLGLPIAGGKVENGVITCPFHNSRFDLCTGKNLDWVQGVAGVKLPAWSRKIIALGKEPTPIQSFPVTEEGGKLFVDL
ncbi:MAG: Rieske (2Fe-2S) protein [Chloroflexi bacterium]|jgi:nitrite reductase/ring-hydroxylating ferredoxin subunit|uniref:Rieske (2Fe-2S) protein n=2 Tax=Candidatus Thermofonsia Clade 3 TaxID=2364209 RepID=A0A2M8QCM3_9CHLR|nr:MAG: Rieske (2Fe-2S) protein [Candidatus Thermofonsia Clade 3 bacterium]RMG62070.1 MAG: Rieske (2Fe-2S) protein [Chloroflexota bacterium]